MIHYIYTGKFTGAELNVQMVAWLADKYDIPGMMNLLCSRMRDDVVGPEIIADMLIAACIQLNVSSRFIFNSIFYFLQTNTTPPP